MTTMYCADCGEPKDSAQLQPSTDAKDRWRLGVSRCKPANNKGERKLSVFGLTYYTKAKWGHGDGATQYCPEEQCDCSDPKPMPGSMLCFCSHNLQKRTN